MGALSKKKFRQIASFFSEPTYDQEIMRLVDKEIRIMSDLDHPHVTHLEEVYEDSDRVCFVMELAQGGEVFDRLVEQVWTFNSQHYFKIMQFSSKK